MWFSATRRVETVVLGDRGDSALTGEVIINEDSSSCSGAFNNTEKQIHLLSPSLYLASIVVIATNNVTY